MEQALKTLAYRVFDLLNMYISVHNDMLGRRGLAWFRKINFPANAQALAQIHLALQSAMAEAERLSATQGCQPRHRSYLSTMTEYLTCLIDTVARLQKVASKMDGKTRGVPYSIGDYNVEMDAYKASVERYTQRGEHLKAAWDVAGL